MKVIRDALLVKADEIGISKGVIYLPEGTEKEVRHGEVVETGRGIISGGQVITPEVKVGDQIIFRSTPMIPINKETEDGEEETLYVISEGQVLVIK